ncbi:SDR family NAD(P)-dependent oxidoreductase [Microbacterium sp. kSW2-24]|uniref:SDR family NAD(P)-dependent oxidoreductase n=1 Tax=Microbacterium galbinum TaxID=2851646 RepID=UPI001FFCF3D2|nr:SDR family NAD(P)-dependent oxidoreductase [Microbacterium galbinum]MCK2022991.1 SDR family NAD(P)-dependent oxidoreductase [Microbacterium galbinum]
MLRLDNRVALVTGAGRGLGADYAKFLASRGAAVVVNNRRRNGESPADDVVAEIAAAGGKAVANYSDVVEDPQGLVDTAMDTYGRLDIVVNNAGIHQEMSFSDPGAFDLIKRYMDVHFYGTVGVTKAAWEHLIASGSGRVINTVSPVMINGSVDITAYVSAKAATVGFTRSLSIEAEDFGITVNAIAPIAATRLSEKGKFTDEFKKQLRDNNPTSLVSPVVAYLAHPENTLNGRNLIVAAGEVQLMTFGKNDGFLDRELTPESVQANLDSILDETTNTVLPYERFHASID